MSAVNIDDLVENIDRFSDPAELIEKFDFVIAYHGTTHRLLESIRENGLLPREESDMHGLDHTGNSVEGRVYFSTLRKADNFAVQRAEFAVEAAGGKPVAVECALRTENLEPDEDTGGDLLTSLSTGKVAHKGVVHPQKSKEHSFLKDVKWVETGQGYEIHEKQSKVKSRGPKREMRQIISEDKKIQRQKGSEAAKNFRERRMKELREKYDSQISIEEFENLLEKHLEYEN